MPQLESQLKLASVLKYLRRGDFGSFRRAAELTGYLDSDPGRFAAADAFLACQLAGFIEVESADAERVWWSTLDRAIDIRSLCPKTIPTRYEASAIENARVRSFVNDADGHALIWGIENKADIPAEACDFGPGFLGRLPRLAAIEKQVTKLEQLGAQFAIGHAESFSPEDAGWRPATAEASTRALLRVRREYGPWQYLVRTGDSRQVILLADQEWALPLARNILGWPLSRFLRADGSITRLARAFRLPSLLLRFIFANADSVTVGPWNDVHGLVGTARDELFAYLDEAS